MRAREETQWVLDWTIIPISICFSITLASSPENKQECRCKKKARPKRGQASILSPEINVYFLDFFDFFLAVFVARFLAFFTVFFAVFALEATLAFFAGALAFFVLDFTFFLADFFVAAFTFFLATFFTGALAFFAAFAFGFGLGLVGGAGTAAGGTITAGGAGGSTVAGIICFSVSSSRVSPNKSAKSTGLSFSSMVTLNPPYQ